MNHESFKMILAKSAKKQFRIGVLLGIIGLLFAAIPFLDPADIGTGGLIVFIILTCLTLFIGVFLIYLGRKTTNQLKFDNHPLMAAILNGDQTFILWFHEQVTTVKNFESRADYQIWLYHRSIKPITISVKKGEVEGTMSYLSQHFPNALVGFTEENRKKMKELSKA